MNQQLEFILSHHKAFSILAGFLLDCLLGDPHCFPHPVRLMGSFISFLEKRLNKSSDSARIQRIKGFFLVFLLTSTGFLIPYAILFVCRLVNPILFLAVETVMCYQCLAARSLFSESMKVYHQLKKGNVEGARFAVSMIVGRDTDVLDETGIAKAAVETVAENTSDGVIAPLFFMALFGASGGMLYKAINTMDSMIAYKNERYRNFGFFAAKLDDFANLIPARLCALLMIFSTFILAIFPVKPRFHPINSIKIFLRDRYKHASPNSAQSESVCAGALGIQLAGDTVYDGVVEKKDFIGDKTREIEYEDIFCANVLMYAATVLALGMCL
ncbi:adenosylcobinamide-phosphate synthase CbiB [uncultured Treponema sp.]|uniref:adenosylcobinamide-phosphate synthase CbiB n=1 Tax=uncultured Treponema sp. TaxID=162155 RepID=UPI0025F7C1BC|nr:adenosylcobinamide-phosphate synthase CbiB [uncultured Treponema sp.]